MHEGGQIPISTTSAGLPDLMHGEKLEGQYGLVGIMRA